MDYLEAYGRMFAVEMNGEAETQRALDGGVEIYLPGRKSADARLAGQLSGAADYFPVAAEAIQEMVQQVGAVRWEGE